MGLSRILLVLMFLCICQKVVVTSHHVLIRSGAPALCCSRHVRTILQNPTRLVAKTFLLFYGTFPGKQVKLWLFDPIKKVNEIIRYVKILKHKHFMYILISMQQEIRLIVNYDKYVV